MGGRLKTAWKIVNYFRALLHACALLFRKLSNLFSLILLYVQPQTPSHYLPLLLLNFLFHVILSLIIELRETSRINPRKILKRTDLKPKLPSPKNKKKTTPLHRDL